MFFSQQLVMKTLTVLTVWSKLRPTRLQMKTNVYKYFASDVVSELISTKDNRYSNFSILEKTKTKGIKKNTHIFSEIA